MAKLLTKISDFVEGNQIFAAREIVVVGVSGGQDSLCLLHSLLSLRESLHIELHAVHLNHGLRHGEAEADARFVAQLAKEWGVAVTVEKRDVAKFARAHKLSKEEAARRVRYEFLAEVAEKIEAKKVAVGHTADDQVETVLMHWLRGAGLAGLRGMRPVQPYPIPSHRELDLVRPLLGISRKDTDEYCRAQGLKPRFDLSNLDTTFFRNRIRQELLPLLATYNPRIREIILRSSQVLADEYEFLHEQGKKIWHRLLREGKNGALAFDLQAWSDLPPNMQRQILRRAVQILCHDLRNIDWANIEPARRALLTKPTGSRLTLARGLSIYRDYDRFLVAEDYPLPDLPLVGPYPLRITIPKRTKLDGWWLVAEVGGRKLVEIAQRNPDPWQAYLDLAAIGEELYMRPRKDGDRFQPLGMGGQEKSLHKFMIEAKIPLHIRDMWPILASREHVLWVVGHRLDERVRIRETSESILHLRFEKQ